MNLALSLAETLEALADQSPNDNMLTAWSAHLSVHSSHPEFISAVAIIFAKFTELQKQIEESSLSPRAKGLYSSAAHALSHYANPFTIGKASTQQLKAAKDRIDLLYLAADALPDELEPSVLPVTVEQLVKELEEILASAQKVELEPALHRLIESSLRTLIMVLGAYQTLGPDGAARLYGAVAAELFRTQVQNPPATRAGKSFLRKAVEVTKKIGGAIIFAGAVVGGANTFLTDGTEIVGLVDGDGQESSVSKAETSGDTHPSPDTKSSQ